MEKTYLKINRADSVVVCLEAMKKGDVVEVDGKSITLNQDTPAGHKVLINDTPAGKDIIKYGYPIGHAITDLKAGDWVNENNLKTNLKGTLTYAYEPVDDQLDIAKEDRTFEGYVRKNGDVGVRNEIWIVPTVGCVNGIAERLADQLRKETGEKDIDAVYAWHHNYGCSQLSGDHENTRTSHSTPMQAVCLYSDSVARTTSLICLNNCLATMIMSASNSSSPRKWMATRWKPVWKYCATCMPKCRRTEDRQCQ